MALRGILFVLLLTLYIVKRTRPRPSNLPLPPGPKGFPLLGAAFSIDISKPWLTYFKWGKSFGKHDIHSRSSWRTPNLSISGDLVYTRIMNMDVLVINSARVVHDLIELRSSIYSDRPKLATVKPYGIANGTILMPYGDTWRLHRRIFHQAMNAEAASSYRPMQCAKARQLVINLADNPRNFSASFHTYATSIIMSIVYGYNTEPTNDPFVHFAENGMEAITKAANPKTAALLGIFPFLLKLPTWIPGSFKAEAAEAKYYADGFRKVLFGMVLARMTSGTDTPSMISDAVRRNEGDGNRPEVTDAIENTSSVAYGAASETTAFSLELFVLAMVLFPEAQRKAQKEIDAVVGTDRLPSFSDRSSLPFVEAVMRETSRWHPTGPVGLAHATTTEDVYEGMYIPRGATVIINTWGLAHDEKTYPEPFRFIPERFLKGDGTLTEDNVSFTFGYGRRYIADASMWIAVAAMLATFDFLKERDDQGNDIEFEPQFTPPTTSWVLRLSLYVPVLINQQTPQALSLSDRASTTRE
ncbi:cytochrome P450 [Butyriboletus roseoflavus]|nr:cytochrome P450 [Butyriboletus roseoflavus]